METEIKEHVKSELELAQEQVANARKALADAQAAADLLVKLEAEKKIEVQMASVLDADINGLPSGVAHTVYQILADRAHGMGYSGIEFRVVEEGAGWNGSCVKVSFLGIAKSESATTTRATSARFSKPDVDSDPIIVTVSGIKHSLPGKGDRKVDLASMCLAFLNDEEKAELAQVVETTMQDKSAGTSVYNARWGLLALAHARGAWTSYMFRG